MERLCCPYWGMMMPRGKYPRPTLAQRILRGSEVRDGCWRWTGTIHELGYGRMSVGNRLRYAHVVSYELFVGTVPEGMELDHKCRNRDCVNPAHLEPVTHQENIRRGAAGALRIFVTHCPRGHLYAGENVYFYPGRNARQCRECRRVSNRRSDARKKCG